MKALTKTKRKMPDYSHLTPAEIAEFKALRALYGNGTAAVRIQRPQLLDPSNRAFRLSKKAKELGAPDFIDNKIQQIGIDAVQRVGIMVNSTDERIATKNSHFVIEQIRGKATQKSIALTGKIKLQDVLA